MKEFVLKITLRYPPGKKPGQENNDTSGTGTISRKYPQSSVLFEAYHNAQLIDLNTRIALRGAVYDYRKSADTCHHGTVTPFLT